MDIRSFMLSNGQELIAELVAATGSGYQIRRPLRVGAMQGQDGVHVGFALWSMIHSVDQTIELLDHALLCRPCTVDQDVADNYMQQVSGIVIASGTSSQILKG
jgi:hypothetical protein